MKLEHLQHFLGKRAGIKSEKSEHALFRCSVSDTVRLAVLIGKTPQPVMIRDVTELEVIEGFALIVKNRESQEWLVELDRVLAVTLDQDKAKVNGRTGF